MIVASLAAMTLSGNLVAVAPAQQPPAQQAPARRLTRTGNIIKWEGFKSAALGNTRNVQIYLPPDYAKDTKQTYPVLIMHDGQNCFDGMTSYIPNEEWRADETAEALIKSGLLPPLIIVAVDNAQMDRTNEYLPVEIKMGNFKGGGKADLYGKMLIEEVLPRVRKEFRTKTGPANTGLCGSSFGGVITLHLGLKHPDVFGKLAIMSPSLWINDRSLLKTVTPVKPRPKIWLDMGTDEGAGSTENAAELYRIFTQNGWKPVKDVVYYQDAFAAHNERAWANRLGMVLTYLFGK